MSRNPGRRDTSHPLGVALEMHMESAKKRAADLATIRSHLEAATAENERLKKALAWEAALKERARTMAVELQTERDFAKAHLETARKALEAIDDDCEYAEMGGCGRPDKCNACIARAALRAIDTPAAPSASACHWDAPACSPSRSSK